MPASSKPAILQHGVFSEVPVSAARPGTGSPKRTNGLILSYSFCSSHAHRSSNRFQSSVGSTRCFLFRLPMLPPSGERRAAQEGCHE